MVWNIVAGDVARSRALSLIDAARLFAFLNVSFNDGIQTSFTSKFVYNMWRPVTAIRLADQDLNDATAADPSWLPLLPTPPYPAYAGNMACLSFASSRALSLTFGRDDIPLSVTWNRKMGLPSETLTFTGFSHLAEEMAVSRIYGGIHFNSTPRPAERCAEKSQSTSIRISCGPGRMTAAVRLMLSAGETRAWVVDSFVRRSRPPQLSAAIRASPPCASSPAVRLCCGDA